MEKKEIAIANPVAIDGVTIIPVSRLSVNLWNGKHGIAFQGSKEPVSIILLTSSEKKVFRITGEEITFDRLTEEYPEITDELEEIRSGSY